MLTKSKTFLFASFTLVANMAFAEEPANSAYREAISIKGPSQSSYIGGRGGFINSDSPMQVYAAPKGNNGNDKGNNGNNKGNNGNNSSSHGNNSSSHGNNSSSHGNNSSSHGNNSSSHGNNSSSHGNNSNSFGSKGNNGNHSSTYGSHGSKGNHGSDGNHGSKGSHGTYGTYGSHGSKGSHGSYGSHGSKGSHGSHGSHGSKGSTTGYETSTTDTTTGVTATTGGDDKEFKAKLKPLFHLRFDYGSYIVNLTPHFRDVEPKSIVTYDYTPTKDTLIYGDYRDGFQKTVYGSIQVGLGAQVKFWFDNASGILEHFWGYVGVLPIVGKDTESVRYVSTLDKAYAMGGRWSVPKDASDIDAWDTGDSITYLGHGGIIFSAGAGLGPVGAGIAKLATGTWETYVEKVNSEKVYVKITRGKLDSYSMFTNVAIVTLSVNDFKYSDDGFSYMFDMTTETGRKAYEDLIRGNVLASENFAANKPQNLVERAPVVKVETFRTVSTGRIASKSLSIPIIWDKTYSKGRVNSFSTSDLHIDRNTAQVHYGIYSDSEDTRFWFKHKEKDFMFYGAKYTIENWDTKEKTNGMFGTYSYSFRHEKSNGSRLRSGIYELVKKTGLNMLMVGVPDRGLGYTGVEFNVTFDEANTMRLMTAAQNMTQDQFIDLSTDQIWGYFNTGGDPYDLCMLDNDVPGSCVTMTSKRTAAAASKMYSALKSMYKYMNSDPKAFAAAYGKFGEGMAQNLFTFRAAMNLAGEGVIVDYLVEGTHTNMYFRQWEVDSSGQWVPATENPVYKGLPFKPATRHSRARGIIIGNSDAAKLPQFETVAF